MTIYDMEKEKDIFKSEKWKKLKPQYRVAILEYCNNFNKTQAYLEAYPKTKSAKQSGEKLFNREDIKEVLQEAIDQLWQEEEKELRASIGKRLKKRGFIDISKVEGFKINPELAEIADFEIIEAKDKNGDPANCIKYKTNSIKALSELAKIAGIVQDQDAPTDFTIYINPVEKGW